MLKYLKHNVEHYLEKNELFLFYFNNFNRIIIKKKLFIVLP